MIYVNLEEVKTYVSNLQITVTQFIAYIPVMDMSLVAERRPGEQVYQK